MPNKRYTPKNIIRQEPNGQTVNYGHLAVGYINGIACLASREVLVRLGVKLSSHKPPEHFYNHEHLQVKFGNHEAYRVFAVNKTAIHRLGQLVSDKGRCLVDCYNVTTFQVSRTWFNGYVTGTDGTDDYKVPPPPKLEHIQMKRTKVKKVGKLRKAWLAIKRMFTPERMEAE